MCHELIDFLYYLITWQVTDKDSGNYKLVIKNSGGEITAMAAVDVEGKSLPTLARGPAPLSCRGLTGRKRLRNN